MSDTKYALVRLRERLGEKAALLLSREEAALWIDCIDAADKMRESGTRGVWSNGKHQPTEQASDYDTKRAALARKIEEG